MLLNVAKGFLLFVLLFTFPASAQDPGSPYFPETANCASYVPSGGFTLNWLNPTGVIYNEVYLSYDSALVASMDTSVRVANGFPSTVYNSFTLPQLYKITRYYWSVVEYGSSSNTPGPIWNFITSPDNYTEYYVNDDFRNGLSNWTITGTGCHWELGFGNTYTLPPPAYGKVLKADNTQCATTVNSTAEFAQINNLAFAYGVWIEFDSDWQAYYSNDEAIVELSTDQGNSWEIVWNKAGVSDRNTHVNIEIFNDWNHPDNVRIRFRTIQNGGESWWAIDNFLVRAWSGALTPWVITNLHTQVNEEANEVFLTWQQNFGVPGVTIYRKEGIPEDNTEYQEIEQITNGSTGYIDTTVEDSTIYTYKVGENPQTTNEATAYIYSVIPVELISFTANVVDRKVNLNWVTATEINNKGFEIQRSKDYKIEKLQDWETIGFVEGKGTTTQTQNYSFVDNPPSGKFLYRLKQIDYDGAYEYSSEIEAEVFAPKEYTLQQNFPNPFNPSTTIGYTITEKGKVYLAVYDILGREVGVLVNEEKEAGEYSALFNSSGLSSGIYVYKILVNGFISSNKMILMK